MITNIRKKAVPIFIYTVVTIFILGLIYMIANEFFLLLTLISQLGE